MANRNDFAGVSIVVHSTCPHHYYRGADCLCDCQTDWQNCQMAWVDTPNGDVRCTNPDPSLSAKGE